MDKVTLLERVGVDWSEAEFNQLLGHGLEIESKRSAPNRLIAHRPVSATSLAEFQQWLGHTDFIIREVDYRYRWERTM